MQAAVCITWSIVVAGCGRLAFDERTDASDSSKFDGDAFVLPHETPFGTPSLAGNLNDNVLDDFDASMTEDRLELYMARGMAANGALDIFVATRASVTAPWSTPVIVAELSSASPDESPEVSRDGLEIWLSSSRAGTAGLSDLWISSRAQRTDPWSTPVRVAPLSSPGADYSPALAADRLAIAFDSDRDGTKSLYVARRPTIGGTWSTPRQVTELDVVGSTSTDPWLSPDGLTLFYSYGVAATAEIYSTTRPSLDSPFEPSTRHVELSVRAGTFDPWLTSDGHYILYDGRAAGGQFDLFEATR